MKTKMGESMKTKMGERVKTRKVVLKLDDFRQVSWNIVSLDKIIRSEQVKITFGIIGEAFSKLEENEINWMKESLTTGLYSYWNHGYTHAHLEFRLLTLDGQTRHLQKTQDIVKDKLGIVLETFGAPGNAYNRKTVFAVESIKEIKYWYYGDANYIKKSFKRHPSVELEYPLGMPNYENFVEKFEGAHGDGIVDCLVLQGHPDMWDKAGFINFMKIICFLKQNDYAFCFPEEV